MAKKTKPKKLKALTNMDKVLIMQTMTAIIADKSEKYSITNEDVSSLLSSLCASFVISISLNDKDLIVHSAEFIELFLRGLPSSDILTFVNKFNNEDDKTDGIIH